MRVQIISIVVVDVVGAARLSHARHDEIVIQSGGKGPARQEIAGRVEEARVGSAVGAEAVPARRELDLGEADARRPVEDVVDGVPVFGRGDVDGVFVVDAELRAGGWVGAECGEVVACCSCGCGCWRVEGCVEQEEGGGG